jgi:xanthine dehydrogenase accessory factor
MQNLRIVIKGAGEMATGIAHRLFTSNVTSIVMTEVPEPVTVRRTVAFSEAVYEGRAKVEGVEAKLIKARDELGGVWESEKIAVIVDPEWKIVNDIRPDVVVDATMTKRYTGTRKEEAPLVIGVGPGLLAPYDVHAVVESNRGHNLGRVIWHGSAEPRSGVPGEVMGYTRERVLRAPREGVVKHTKTLGDSVNKGDLILYVGETPVYATIAGILRGLIREISVLKGEKIGDIDPRGNIEFCHTITDKARAIAGGALEAILHFYN